MIEKIIHSRYPIILILAALGFTANWFKLELFFNVDFIFGSIFVLLASARFGILPGIMTGAVAGSCTWLLWHHPWAMVIGIAEAAVVGTIIRRRSCTVVSLLAADTLYWIFCGAPLVWFFYHQILGIPDQSTLLIVLKQSLNGICNATLAQLIMLGVQSYRAEPGQLPRFRQLLFTVMVSMVLLMGMLAIITDLRDTVKRQERQLINDIEHTSRIAATSINATLLQQLQSVTALSQLVGDHSKKIRSELQQLVTSVNAVIPAFQWMGILDRTSTTIAYDPPLDENGRSNLGVNYSDRPYISILQNSLKPYISDIVIGKLGNRNPRALMLSPIVINGNYGGFCVGVANLDLIQELLKTLPGTHNMHVTLVDRKNQVVASTRNDITTMSSLEYSRGEKRPVSPNIFQLIPSTAPNNSIMQRWRQSRFIVEQQLSDELPWKVVIEISPNAMLDILTSKSIHDLTIVLVIFLASGLVATLLNRLFLKPLENLQKITGDVPGFLPGSSPKPVWPNSRIFELHALSSNFSNMTDLLSDKFMQQEKTYQLLALETEKRQHLELQMTLVREQVEKDERGRISRDLHDSLGQSLQAVRLNLQIMKARCENANGCNSQKFDDVILEIKNASDELRDIVSMLRPPVLPDQRLSDALEWMADQLSRRSGVTIRMQQSGIPEQLPEELKTGVFRICQEALSNALRHGKPTVVEIIFSCIDKRLSLRIQDNGSGFDPDICSIGSGIGIMRERTTLLGGTFELKSLLVSGTEVVVEVQLP